MVGAPHNRDLIGFIGFIVASKWKLPMNALHVALFGKISVQQDGQPITDLSAKALELLCYLLLYHSQSHTRDALAELLWPDAASERSQKYLRQTLWHLQTRLDSQPNHAQAETLFVLHPGWVCLNPKANWSADVDIFEQAYTLCRDVADHELSERDAQRLEEAVQLYQGDFMANWYLYGQLVSELVHL
jgi:DNA-binding SARP family transcriptional activator